MSKICLCEFSDSELWTGDYFVEHTKVLCSEGAKLLQIKSQIIEESAHELIHLLCGDYREHLVQSLENQNASKSRLGSANQNNIFTDLKGINDLVFLEILLIIAFNE